MDAIVEGHGATIQFEDLSSPKEDSVLAKDSSLSVGEVLGKDSSPTRQLKSTVTPNIPLSEKCWIGSETTLDLMTPDRQVLIRMPGIIADMLPLVRWIFDSQR